MISHHENQQTEDRLFLVDRTGGNPGHTGIRAGR